MAHPSCAGTPLTPRNGLNLIATCRIGLVGLGRLTLNQEDTGSNPVCDTNWNCRTVGYRVVPIGGCLTSASTCSVRVMVYLAWLSPKRIRVRIPYGVHSNNPQ